MKPAPRPNQPPLVSIIIPVFNKCDLTGQCLKALAEVTSHIPHEIIVVDNASTDATPQRLQNQPPHVRYLRNEVNRNFAGACNQGAALATGKHLLFLNNDTIPTRGWLDALLDELRLHPEVAAVGGKLLYESGQIQHAGVIFTRETRNPYHPYRLLRPDDPRVNHRRELQAVTAACVLIRPKWFQDCGGFCEEFRNGYEDLDLCLKIRQRGGIIVYQPKCLVFHLESQSPGRMKFDNENRALFFQRWQTAVLADEDAFYFADGYYKRNQPDRPAELPHLIRFAHEAERAQWQQVAQSQTLAAQWQRPQLVEILSNDQAWPAEAAVRRWAGCLAQRLKLRDVAQRHFTAALALEEDALIRLLLASTPASVPPASPEKNSSAAALTTGLTTLQAGEFQNASAAFERALFQGASPALALTGLWQASQLAGQDAQVARHALLNLARLNPATTRLLTGPTPACPVQSTAIAPASATPAPVVSIIIPVYDKLELTRVCLDSLAGIPAEVPCEIIVVDNASTDGTNAYLQAQAGAGTLRVVTNARNEGFARACNQGAQAARGAWLLFLNNDTQVISGWLGALVKTAQDTQAGAVGAKLLYANGTIQHAGIGFINGLPDHPHRHAPANLPAANQRRELDMVTGACLLTPTDLFQSLGGFDEVFRNGVEDVDYCLRVRATGRKVIYEPHSVVYHHEGQSVGRFNHVNENLKIFFARWGKSFDAQTHFIVPAPPAIIRASRTCLAAGQSAVSPVAPATTVTVSWEGSFLDHGSLSHVNRELVGGLKNFPAVRVKCVTNGGPVAADAATAWPQWIKEVAPTPAADATITVRHAWPPKWQRPARGKLVVIQPWEFGSLPETWVRQAREVDEFWLPSEYVRRVYVASGVPAEKVFVVPNGVDLEKFHPTAAPMPLATAKKFKFLFVGGTIGRKGPDLLLQAYLQNFTAADDVCLVIKDFGGQSVYTGQTFETAIRAAQARPNAPEILYLNQELPPEQLPGLYTACDCLVMPYRGEGFGLPALEAMACGRPLIVTGSGGATDDFVRDEFAWRLPAERKVCGQEISGLKLVNPGWLLEPQLAALGEAMRHAFGQPEAARLRGQLARQQAQNWSWKNSATLAAQRLQALAATPATPAKAAAPAPVPLPAVAALGKLDEARAQFARKEFAAAWNATQAALAQRPFHPEAWLLLAEIALAAGAGRDAKALAQRARDLAPGWSPVKQFLTRPLKGTTRPDWLDAACLAARPPRLSVCLIVKNEERFIAQCLKSVHGFATQIVVVDTGSTDRTVEIAKEFGAEIHAFAWCDDFAAARNAALAHATGDWVLMLDADEELPPAQHSKLTADMQAADIIARRLPLVNVGSEREGRSVVPRLFRNAPGVFFHGRIHEQVFSSLLLHAKKWGLKTALGTAELRHHGYTKELLVDRNKIARNLKLLELALAENPTDVNLLMNLGLELVRSENLGTGLQKYREAYERMSAQPAADVVPELREVLFTQYTSQLYKLRQHPEVVALLTSPLAQQHGGLTASLHFSLGLSYFELKQYREAAEQMRQCQAKRQQPALTPINTDILTAAPQHCLALCLARLEDAAGAEAAFQAALAEAGHVEAVKLDYAKFLRTAGRAVEALTQLNEIVGQNNQFVAAWQLGGEIALSQPDFLEFAGDWTGEAVKALPDNPALATQRAEALLLTGQAAEAARLWENLWRSEPQARSLAALILCELVTQPTTHAPEAGDAEAATSRAFVEWYQKLIAVRAQTMTERINEQIEKLSRALPAAAQMLATALTEAAHQPTT